MVGRPITLSLQLELCWVELGCDNISTCLGSSDQMLDVDVAAILGRVKGLLGPLHCQNIFVVRA